MNMFKSLAVAGTAAFLLLGAPDAAKAQMAPGTQTNPNPTGTGGQDRLTTERLERERQERNDRRTNRRSRGDEAPTAPAAPTSEQLIAGAQAISDSANAGCQVTEAVALGVTAERQPIFEAACATGPGYILIASTPPQAADCVLLAGQAEIERRRNPDADVGVQCNIPANQDIVRVIAAYAQEAGIRCTVDQAASVGKTPENDLVYEVGCAGADGYWLTKLSTGWETTPCLQVLAQGGSCRYTDAAEQAASAKTMLAGSAIAACDVQQVRFMGGNANGQFYEVKCSEAEGYILRTNAENAIQQTYPCAEASRIGGGCRLITVAAAATAPAPAE